MLSLWFSRSLWRLWLGVAAAVPLLAALVIMSELPPQAGVNALRSVPAVARVIGVERATVSPASTVATTDQPVVMPGSGSVREGSAPAAVLPETTALAASARFADDLDGWPGSPEPGVAAVPVAPLEIWGAAPVRLAGTLAPQVAALGAVVLDETSGSVLYQKAAYERMRPASVTKILTALIALERGSLSDSVTVSVDGMNMPGSSVMGLVPGDTVTLEALLYGLMLPSGNDAALAIAEHIAGSVPAFVEMMNERSAELGLEDSHWANPHGLDADDHYTSAYDLAVLTRTAMQREDFRIIADARSHHAAGTLKTYALYTLNPLYGRVAGLDGGKTGYTRRALQTIVGSATQNGHRVYVVTLVSPDRATDSAALFDWAFAAHRWLPGDTAADDEGR